MSILLVDNFDSFTYNLFQMVQALTPTPVIVKRNNAITWAEVEAMAPSHVILSPGPGHPAVERDFGVCRDILAHGTASPFSLLGVCLGHQGMIHSLGGTIHRAPAIVHGKASQMVPTDIPTPLFEGLPRPFPAMRYHSLVADPTQFPHDELDILAYDDQDHLIMAVQHKSRPWYGVQFHPESIGTPHGSQLLRNFLEKGPRFHAKP